MLCSSRPDQQMSKLSEERARERTSAYSTCLQGSHRPLLFHPPPSPTCGTTPNPTATTCTARPQRPRCRHFVILALVLQHARLFSSRAPSLAH